MTIQRKYDFQSGTRISSQQVDDEFNQIIGELNGHTQNTSDPHQAYAQAVAWAKGFGLGDKCVTYNGDLHALLATEGFYYASSTSTNKPTGVTGGYVIPLIHPSSTLYGALIFIDFNSDSMYFKVLKNGTWGSWKLLANYDQDVWTNLTLQNSWVAYGSGYATPGYRKNNNGEVELRGVVKSGVVTNGTIIATLPSGYRPNTSKPYIVSSFDGTNNVISRVVVQTDGTIQFYGGSNNYLALENIPAIPTT